MSLTERRGVTLVELLVAVSVTSILVLALLQVIRRTTETVRTNQARTTLVTNLNSTGQRLANAIRGQGRDSTESRAKYRLIGVNGDGSEGFVNDLRDTGRPLNAPGGADHLHLHPSRNSPNIVTPHLCFFLSNGAHSELDDANDDGNDEWGLIRRHGEPGSPGSRWDAGRIELLNYDEAQPIGFNIDYLSFRYFDRDSAEPRWFNDWDTDDDSLRQIDGSHADRPIKGPEYPDAIEFAIRAYDPHGRVDPRWYVSTVNFSRYAGQ